MVGPDSRQLAGYARNRHQSPATDSACVPGSLVTFRAILPYGCSNQEGKRRLVGELPAIDGFFLTIRQA
jgi:hypothetical protein